MTLNMRIYEIVIVSNCFLKKRFIPSGERGNRKDFCDKKTTMNLLTFQPKW